MIEVYRDFPKSSEVNVGMVLIQPLQILQLLSLNICLAVLSDTTGYVHLLVWSRDFENLCVLHAPFNSCPQDNVFKNPQRKLTINNLIRAYVNLVREYELPHFAVSCERTFFLNACVCLHYSWGIACQVKHSSVHMYRSGASTQPEITAVNQFIHVTTTSSSRKDCLLFYVGFINSHITSLKRQWHER